MHSSYATVAEIWANSSTGIARRDRWYDVVTMSMASNATMSFVVPHVSLVTDSLRAL